MTHFVTQPLYLTEQLKLNIEAGVHNVHTDRILNLAASPFEEKAISLVGIQPIFILFFPIS